MYPAARSLPGGFEIRRSPSLPAAFRFPGIFPIILSIGCPLSRSSALADGSVSAESPPAVPSPALLAVRIEPLALLSGIYGLAAEFGISQNVTLGLIGELFSPPPGLHRVWACQGGVVSTIYLSGPRFRSGWFLQPGFDYVTVAASRLALDLRTGNYVISATGGYEWDWNGPNLLLGAGLSYFTSPGSSGVEPALNLQAGWVF